MEVDKISQSSLSPQFRELEAKSEVIYQEKQVYLNGLVQAIKEGDEVKSEHWSALAKNKQEETNRIRTEVKSLMKQNDFAAETNDTNYIFLSFVMRFLPAGLIGLLIAVIFSASMSSTSSELNALASTTVVDIYKRMFRPEGSDQHYLKVSKFATVLWGIYAILVAMFANQMGSLIEAVNKLGSLFYGTILGIFVVAFYFKRIRGSVVFYAALVAEAIVIYCFYIDLTAFLWLNLIGCVSVVFVSFLFSIFMSNRLPERN